MHRVRARIRFRFRVRVRVRARGRVGPAIGGYASGELASTLLRRP